MRLTAIIAAGRSFDPFCRSAKFRFAQNQKVVSLNKKAKPKVT